MACRSSSARSLCCANWKSCRTRRLPGSPRFPWAPSCPDWRGRGSGCMRSLTATLRERDRMECHKAEYLLHGYLDGELELLGSYEFERHIDVCAQCADRVAKEQSLRRRFAGTLLRFHTSP